MFGKKTAVIYFSHTGVTKKLVEKFPLEEGDKAIELIPSVPYPKSYFKTLARAKAEIEGKTYDVESVNFLIEKGENIVVDAVEGGVIKEKKENK